MERDFFEKEIENLKRNPLSATKVDRVQLEEKLEKSRKKCQELEEVVARLNEEKRVLTDRVKLAEERSDRIFTANLKMANEKNHLISELNKKIKELENKIMESDLGKFGASEVGLNLDSEVVVVDALLPANGSSDNGLSKKGSRNSVNPPKIEGIDDVHKVRTSPGKQSAPNPPQEENNEQKEPLGSGANIGGMKLLSSSQKSSRASPPRSAKRKLDNKFEETTRSTPAEEKRDKKVSKNGSKININDKSIRSQKRKRLEKAIITPSQSTRSKKTKITKENIASDVDFETVKSKTYTKCPIEFQQTLEPTEQEPEQLTVCFQSMLYDDKLDFSCIPPRKLQPTLAPKEKKKKMMERVVERVSKDVDSRVSRQMRADIAPDSSAERGTSQQPRHFCPVPEMVEDDHNYQQLKKILYDESETGFIARITKSVTESVTESVVARLKEILYDESETGLMARITRSVTESVVGCSY